jgi:biofilm PGA synthesis N-glycosyltransferase PgaC
MVEALRSVPPWHQRRLLARVVAGIDLLIPLLDIGYVLIWLPGLLLAAFGFPLIVGMWTLLVLPITVLVYGGLRRYQHQKVFGQLQLEVRRNRLGYLSSSWATSCCARRVVTGYMQELAGTHRRWK